MPQFHWEDARGPGSLGGGGPVCGIPTLLDPVQAEEHHEPGPLPPFKLGPFPAGTPPPSCTSLGRGKGQGAKGAGSRTGPGLRGRHRGIASLVFSHRGSASERISAARTRIARIFASHRIASHRIAISCLARIIAHIALLPGIARYGPLRSLLAVFSNCGRFGRGSTTSWVPPTSRDPLPVGG